VSVSKPAEGKGKGGRKKAIVSKDPRFEENCTTGHLAFAALQLRIAQAISTLQPKIVMRKGTFAVRAVSKRN